MKTLSVLGLVAVSALGLQADDRQDSIRRIDAAATVFNEIMSAPDKGIPQDLLEKAKCVGIVPGLKRAGFIIGGRYGKGVMVCRANNSMGWTGPSTIRVEGGSIGAQIGAGETDVVLVVMNERGAQRLMRSEFTLGGDVAAMAGPVGREAAANTDAYLSAEILSYSRSRGLFAGITLNGATLRSDDKDNEYIYGRPVDHEAILRGQIAPPSSARPLYAALNQYAGAVNARRSGPATSTSGQANRSRIRDDRSSMGGTSTTGNDSLTLTDGRTITGQVLGMSGNTIRFRGDDGSTQNYPRSQVSNITFAPPAGGSNSGQNR